ncbi:MAG: hypothetical protein NC331_05275 [Lachnospiraceae bacterium]|nr:hypothetical protein [Lachnospiraceae bacterium]
MGYSYEELKEYAYMRRKNLCMMNALMARIAPESCSLLPKESFCPYVAAYSLENVADKDKVIDTIHKLGIPMTFWPDLHPDVERLESAETARILSRNILVLPIHQDIKPMQLAKRLNVIDKCGTGSPRLSMHWIKGDDVEAKGIQRNLPIELLSVAQDWKYGYAKEKAQKWRPDRAIITDQAGNPVGILQALVKRVADIPVAVRVRRGPAFIKEYHNLENMLYVMDLVKKKYKRPIFYEPNIEFSPSGLALLQAHGWKCWNYFGFPSGIIDLTRPLDEIRAGLSARWRSNLRIAEKSGLRMLIGNERYQDILTLYQDHARAKGFKATDEKILSALFEMEQCPFVCYRVENVRNEIISCCVVYLQCSFAYYYIAMSFEEGRAVCANHFMLFYICEDLQKRGIQQFDLVGIEPIHTEQIAQFKDGMRPRHYELSGEMIWLPGMS